MIRNKFFVVASLLLAVTSAQLLGQDDAVSYEVLYDEPFAINKLFVHVQPLYGELFATNVNAGFGLKADYYLQDKADFTASFRKSYGRQFLDLTRDQAVKNGEMENRPRVFTYLELGGAYHFRDEELSSVTRVVLYNDSLKGDKWAASVPQIMSVPSKVRRAYGARLGGMLWGSSVDLDRVFDKQNYTNGDLIDEEGTPMPNDARVFTNMSAAGLYAGGFMAWIRNVGVSFSKFNDRIDDQILTAYLDVLVAPAIQLDHVAYIERDPGGFPIHAGTYHTDFISVSKVGARAGLEGKFNRTLGWAYGGEVGYRPGIQGMGFYVMFRISVPVYGSELTKEAEPTGQ